MAGLHKKVTGRFGRSFQVRSDMIQLRNDKILVVIQISIWICERILQDRGNFAEYVPATW